MALSSGTVLKEISKTLEEINTTLKVLSDQAAEAAASNKNVMVTAAAAETSGGASRSRFEDEEIDKRYTVARCLGILDKMYLHWTGDEFLRVLKLLRERGWREMFIEMSDVQRKQWLECF